MIGQEHYTRSKALGWLTNKQQADGNSDDRTAWLYNPDGTLHAEVIEGVTTEVYTYATDYPRIEVVQAGDSVDVRTTSRTYFRGLWLQEEEIVETGNPDGVLRTFGTWDAFGSPRVAERWVGASLEAEYVSTTDPLGRLSGLTASTATGFNGEGRVGEHREPKRPDRAAAGRGPALNVPGAPWTWRRWCGCLGGRRTRRCEANSALSTIGTSWAGSLTYTRDATTGLVDNVASGTGVVATVMSRDVMGRPEDIALAGGAAITSTWDVLGRVQERTSRSTAGDEQTRAWGYDSRGRTDSQLTYENGILTQTINYEFAEPGWLLSEERITATDINATEYDYDLGGNRTEKREVNMTGAIVSTQTYAYAWGNELTDVSGAAVTWNAFGGRPQGDAESTGPSHSRAPADKAGSRRSPPPEPAAKAGVRGVTTDHRGLDILRDADGLEWGIGTPVGIRHVITRDAFGTPVAVDADGDDTTANVRAQMWGPSLSDAPVAGVDGSGDGVMTVAIDGIAVGRLEGGAFVAMGTDKNGSVIMDGLAMLADAGAFGEHAVAAAGSDETRVYAGLDSLVGTAYQLPRRRFYDAELGRFTSIDPSGLAGGGRPQGDAESTGPSHSRAPTDKAGRRRSPGPELAAKASVRVHRFLYTSNNPVDFVDPSGLSRVQAATQMSGQVDESGQWLAKGGPDGLDNGGSQTGESSGAARRPLGHAGLLGVQRGAGPQGGSVGGARGHDR